MKTIKFVPNSFSGRDYQIEIDNSTVGECDRDVVDVFNDMCPNVEMLASEKNDIVFKLYEEMHKELNTLKWIGADEGWELAIEAVQRFLLKKAKDVS